MKEFAQPGKNQKQNLGLETPVATGQSVGQETGLLPREFECCQWWKDQNEKIDGPIVLQQIRSGVRLPGDHFVAWKFCPWCGASRVQGSEIRAGKTPVDTDETNTKRNCVSYEKEI